LLIWSKYRRFLVSIQSLMLPHDLSRPKLPPILRVS
jgi:hypothetical protein